MITKKSNIASYTYILIFCSMSAAAMDYFSDHSSFSDESIQHKKVNGIRSERSKWQIPERSQSNTVSMQEKKSHRQPTDNIQNDFTVDLLDFSNRYNHLYESVMRGMLAYYQDEYDHALIELQGALWQPAYQEMIKKRLPSGVYGTAHRMMSIMQKKKGRWDRALWYEKELVTLHGIAWMKSAGITAYNAAKQPMQKDESMREDYFEQSFDYFKQTYSGKFPHCGYEYARALCFGKGCPQDKDKAVAVCKTVVTEYAKASAALADPHLKIDKHALRLKWQDYKEGEEDKIVHLLRILACEGNVQAGFFCYDQYPRGFKSEQSIDAAIWYLISLKKSGDASKARGIYFWLKSLKSSNNANLKRFLMYHDAVDNHSAHAFDRLIGALIVGREISTDVLDGCVWEEEAEQLLATQAEQLRFFLSRSCKHDTTGISRYLLGRAALCRGDYSKAQRQFKKAFQGTFFGKSYRESLYLWTVRALLHTVQPQEDLFKQLTSLLSACMAEAPRAHQESVVIKELCSMLTSQVNDYVLWLLHKHDYVLCSTIVASINDVSALIDAISAHAALTNSAQKEKMLDAFALLCRTNVHLCTSLLSSVFKSTTDIDDSDFFDYMLPDIQCLEAHITHGGDHVEDAKQLCGSYYYTLSKHHGCDKGHKKGLGYLNKSCGYGNIWAKYHKAQLLLNDVYSVPQQKAVQEGLALLEECAEGDVTSIAQDACVFLGGFYHDRSSVCSSFTLCEHIKKDNAKAYVYLCKAAEYGDPRVNLSLGTLYYYGAKDNNDETIVPIDFEKARSYFTSFIQHYHDRCDSKDFFAALYARGIIHMSAARYDDARADFYEIFQRQSSASVHIVGCTQWQAGMLYVVSAKDSIVPSWGVEHCLKVLENKDINVASITDPTTKDMLRKLGTYIVEHSAEDECALDWCYIITRWLQQATHYTGMLETDISLFAKLLRYLVDREHIKTYQWVAAENYECIPQEIQLFSVRQLLMANVLDHEQSAQLRERLESEASAGSIVACLLCIDHYAQTGQEDDLKRLLKIAVNDADWSNNVALYSTFFKGIADHELLKQYAQGFLKNDYQEHNQHAAMVLGFLYANVLLRGDIHTIEQKKLMDAVIYFQRCYDQTPKTKEHKVRLARIAKVLGSTYCLAGNYYQATNRIDSAIMFWTKGAELNNVSCRHLIIDEWLQYQTTKQGSNMVAKIEEKTIMNWLMPLVKAKDPRAQLSLSMYYVYKRDTSSARLWLQRAAEGGYEQAIELVKKGFSEDRGIPLKAVAQKQVEMEFVPIEPDAVLHKRLAQMPLVKDLVCEAKPNPPAHSSRSTRKKSLAKKRSKKFTLMPVKEIIHEKNNACALATLAIIRFEGKAGEGKDYNIAKSSLCLALTNGIISSEHDGVSRFESIDFLVLFLQFCQKLFARIELVEIKDGADHISTEDAVEFLQCISMVPDILVALESKPDMLIKLDEVSTVVLGYAVYDELRLLLHDISKDSCENLPISSKLAEHISTMRAQLATEQSLHDLVTTMTSLLTDCLPYLPQTAEDTASLQEIREISKQVLQKIEGDDLLACFVSSLTHFSTFPCLTQMLSNLLAACDMHEKKIVLHALSPACSNLTLCSTFFAELSLCTKKEISEILDHLEPYVTFFNNYHMNNQSAIDQIDKGSQELCSRYFHALSLSCIDNESALPYIDRACWYGSMWAKYHKAELLIHGQYGTISPDQAVQQSVALLEECACCDDASLASQACLLLATFYSDYVPQSKHYRYQKLVKKNNAKAFVYLQKSIDKGSQDALLFLGHYYCKGLKDKKGKQLVPMSNECAVSTFSLIIKDCLEKGVKTPIYWKALSARGATYLVMKRGEDAQADLTEIIADESREIESIKRSANWLMGIKTIIDGLLGDDYAYTREAIAYCIKALEEADLPLSLITTTGVFKGFMRLADTIIERGIKDQLSLDVCYVAARLYQDELIRNELDDTCEYEECKKFVTRTIIYAAEHKDERTCRWFADPAHGSCLHDTIRLVCMRHMLDIEAMSDQHAQIQASLKKERESGSQMAHLLCIDYCLRQGQHDRLTACLDELAHNPIIWDFTDIGCHALLVRRITSDDTLKQSARQFLQSNGQVHNRSAAMLLAILYTYLALSSQECTSDDYRNLVTAITYFTRYCNEIACVPENQKSLSCTKKILGDACYIAGNYNDDQGKRDTAIMFWMKGVEHGHELCQLCIAESWLGQEAKDKPNAQLRQLSEQKILGFLQPLLAKKDARAQCAMAMYCLNKKKASEAHMWFESSAKGGCAMAINMLAQCNEADQKNNMIKSLLRESKSAVVSRVVAIDHSATIEQNLKKMYFTNDKLFINQMIEPEDSQLALERSTPCENYMKNAADAVFSAEYAQARRPLALALRQGFIRGGKDKDRIISVPFLISFLQLCKYLCISVQESKNGGIPVPRDLGFLIRDIVIAFDKRSTELACCLEMASKITIDCLVYTTLKGWVDDNA